MATRKSDTSSITRKHPATAASSAVDAQLAHYRSMRDFNLTAEPSGTSTVSNSVGARKPGTARGLPFVIQKHDASHLHYDFRLAWGGVLKSWAVAKGPSYNPQDRRLAVEVEDHPLEYGGFEGIIPEGQYGGGTVMIWDQGSWWPQLGSENVEACLRSGHLKFEINGSKMKGKWALIRMNSHSADEPDTGIKSHWLLIKEHDKYERGPGDPAITDERPNSAITGRSIPQIAAARDHVWGAADPDADASSASPSHSNAPKSKPRSHHAAAISLDALPRESQPDFIAPQLALEATAAPTAGDWLHELKLDGYRIQARKSGSEVTLLTRKGLDWTHRMPAIAAAVAQLPTHDCTLDGEVVVLAPDGNSSFALLQASFQDAHAHPLTYFLFDLLHLDGHSTRDLTLRERKHLLAHLLPAPEANGDANETLHLSEDIPGNGETVFQHACQLHAEGIISKRADAPYRSIRSADWLKSKCLREQELVIAGFTLSSEGPDRIGALLLGYYPPPTRGKHTPAKLIYAGRTGTGFSQQLRRDLLTRLIQLRVPEPAFDHVPPDATRGAYWVQPDLVAQVRFATWTSDNLVRQAAFLGLREDKSASEVTRESPTIAPKPRNSTPRPKPESHQPKNPKRITPRPRVSLHPETLQRFSLSTPKPRPRPVAPPVTLRLTHPDKILDPETGLTKQQLADYYAAVADRMFPHIANRPLSLVRCPDGTAKPCFFQKHINTALPPGIRTIAITDKTSDQPEPYITLDEPQAILSFAQFDALEIHPWGCTNNHLEHPDRLIFDLDPDPAIPWLTLAAAAAEVRQRLKNTGLESFLKLTGGKGLHIVAPIESTITWAELKAAARALALSMQRDNPALYLTKMTKSSRHGKIFLDYLRNQRGATAVAPYSPRAGIGAHVSLPLPWSALNHSTHPVFSVHNLDAWRSRLRTDPWKSLLTTQQQLHPFHFAAL
jgi:bifunctional non-homologous end joining protein LigD